MEQANERVNGYKQRARVHMANSLPRWDELTSAMQEGLVNIVALFGAQEAMRETINTYGEYAKALAAAVAADKGKFNG